MTGGGLVARAEMPAPARRFLFAIILIGSAALVGSAYLASESPHLLAVVVVAAAIVLGDLPIVHVHHGEQTHTFNWSEASLVTGLVLLPDWWLPLVGVLVVAAGYARKRMSAAKVVFNAMSFAGASFAATAVFVAVEPTDPDSSILSLAAAVVVYFVWNVGTVSTIVALSRGTSVLATMGSGLQLAALFTVANSSIAILIATAAPREPIVLLAVPPVLVQLLFVYRNTREVIGDRDLWVRVQDLSVDLQRASAADLPGVALDAIDSMVSSDHLELVVLHGEHVATRYGRGPDGTEITSDSILEVAGDVWGRLDCDRMPFWIDASTATRRQQGWLADRTVDHVLVQPLEWGTELIGFVRIGVRDRAAISSRLESTLTTVCTQIASAFTGVRQTQVLRHQAEHDPVTELANRIRLVDHLDMLLTRPDAASFAVLFLDLDGFKVVNDSLGHHIGDDVLRVVARRLNELMRPGDVVARFGGDEFVVVCNRVDDVRSAEAIADRILASLETPAVVAGQSVPLSASVGIVCASGRHDDLDPEMLLRDADVAMYEAKRRGPGSRTSFTAGLRQEALDRLHMESDLRRALEDGELEVHYQPIVDLTTGSLSEVEALARWTHRTRGMVSPVAFVAMAEETGLIRQLGLFVLQRSCADMRRWLDLGLVPPSMRISVNLSPLQLDGTLPAVVGDVLAAHDLPPSALTLEVTESALVADPDAVGSLERLRALGVHVSLDDFGTGYSSLSALRDLPVDTVKIDRSFVSRLGADDRMDALVTGIIELTHALEMRVVGEGVETADQAEMLTEMGCDRVQGWLHGRPMSPPLLEAMFASDVEPTSAPGQTPPKLRAL